MGDRALDLADLVVKVRSGELTGEALGKMVVNGTLSKSERRHIQRKAAKPELTARQLLRQEIKAKKALPRGKLSKEERNAKFSSVDETERERLKEEANFTICLGCRKRGHFLKDCPKLGQEAETAVATRGAVDGICFNCGQTDHILKNCPRPRDRNGKLPFAMCFICHRKGHISRDCDQNANGLYPQGGCCHICLQKTHLVRDCPERTEEMKEEWARKRAEQAQEDEDRELGPRVRGLVAGEDGPVGGGDDVDDFGASDDEDAPSKKDNPKRDKKDKKKSGGKGDRGDKKEKRKERGEEGDGGDGGKRKKGRV